MVNTHKNEVGEKFSIGIAGRQLPPLCFPISLIFFNRTVWYFGRIFLEVLSFDWGNKIILKFFILHAPPQMLSLSFRIRCLIITIAVAAKKLWMLPDIVRFPAQTEQYRLCDTVRLRNSNIRINIVNTIKHTHTRRRRQRSTSELPKVHSNWCEVVFCVCSFSFSHLPFHAKTYNVWICFYDEQVLRIHNEVTHCE